MNVVLVVGVTVGTTVFLLLLVAGVTCTVFLVVITRKKEQKKMAKVCVFSMKKSNVVMVQLKDKTVCNKKVLKFDETREVIPVDMETKELVCIRNKGKYPTKVQITTKQGCEKYTIRTDPSSLC